MKKRFNFVIIPLSLIVIIAGTFLFLTREVKLPEGAEEFSAADTSFTPLPADAKLAQKELLRARKNLEKLAPKGQYIVVDTHANKLSYRTADSLIYKFTCSTGCGGVLIDSVTGRKWIFNTPHGVFKIKNKIKDPWWRKPDWEYIQENEPIPKDEGERLDPEMLGAYAMGIGDGYFIHGTVYERLLGVNVTHGCIRLGSDDLKTLYDRVTPGTQVYIF